MPIEAQLAKALAQVPTFRALTLEEAIEFFDQASEVASPQGATIFHEGDPSDSLLVILEGEVLVTHKNIELARLDYHAVLGEMSIVDGAPRSATAKALVDTKLLEVPLEHMQRLLKAHNLGALKVVAHLATIMSKRLSLINEKLVVALSQGQGQRRPELADFERILNRWNF